MWKNRNNNNIENKRKQKDRQILRPCPWTDPPHPEKKNCEPEGALGTVL